MRIFIDMDGTLAVWKPTKKIEDLYASGYFAVLPPQKEVVEAVHLLAKIPDMEVYILSAVFEDCRCAVFDKNRWLDRYLPEIKRECRIFASGATPKYMAVPGGIRPGDVLLDDYTVNLLCWAAQEGAVGVKLLNGINHSRSTWKGAKVHKDQGADAIVSAILKVAEREE